ncbi:MAG: toll/interleukin-1 receptor domain-containing protein [Halobacteriota archaeon]
MSREIFISYSHEDKAIADKVCHTLEASNIACWIAPRDERPGEKWAHMIVRGMDETKMVVFILSAHSNRSSACENELSLAQEKRKVIIPVRVEDVPICEELEWYLTGRQRIEALSRPIDQHLGELVAAVRDSLQHPATVPPSDEPPATGPRDEESLSLAKILPGVWQIQITHPSGMVGQMGLELGPSGAFQGQLIAPSGQLMIQGMWQLVSPNQLALQGQQSNGFVMWPYGAVLTFNNVTPGQLSGFSDVGEQVVCQKVR